MKIRNKNENRTINSRNLHIPEIINIASLFANSNPHTVANHPKVILMSC